MTTIDTTPRKSTSEFREELLIAIGDRSNELRLKVAHANSEMHNLRIQQHQHADRMDFDAARQAAAQFGRHQEDIRSYTKQLSDLEIEREGIVRGSDSRMAGHMGADAQKNRHDAQQEHAEALSHFNEMTKASGELVLAAQRIIEICKGMHLEAPASAHAIVQAI